MRGGPGALEEGRFCLLSAGGDRKGSGQTETGTGAGQGLRGWGRRTAEGAPGRRQRHDRGGPVQRPRGLVQPARVGVEEVEVKEDEA